MARRGLELANGLRAHEESLMLGSVSVHRSMIDCVTVWSGSVPAAEGPVRPVTGGSRIVFAPDRDGNFELYQIYN
jgi:hypothetical protein